MTELAWQKLASVTTADGKVSPEHVKHGASLTQICEVGIGPDDIDRCVAKVTEKHGIQITDSGLVCDEIDVCVEKVIEELVQNVARQEQYCMSMGDPNVPSFANLIPSAHSLGCQPGCAGLAKSAQVSLSQPEVTDHGKKSEVVMSQPGSIPDTLKHGGVSRYKIVFSKKSQSAPKLMKEIKSSTPRKGEVCFPAPKKFDCVVEEMSTDKLINDLVKEDCESYSQAVFTSAGATPTNESPRKPEACNIKKVMAGETVCGHREADTPGVVVLHAQGMSMWELLQAARFVCEGMNTGQDLDSQHQTYKLLPSREQQVHLELPVSEETVDVVSESLEQPTTPKRTRTSEEYTTPIGNTLSEATTPTLTIDTDLTVSQTSMMSDITLFSDMSNISQENIDASQETGSDMFGLEKESDWKSKKSQLAMYVADPNEKESDWKSKASQLAMYVADPNNNEVVVCESGRGDGNTDHHIYPAAERFINIATMLQAPSEGYNAQHPASVATTTNISPSSAKLASPSTPTTTSQSTDTIKGQFSCGVHHQFLPTASILSKDPIVASQFSTGDHTVVKQLSSAGSRYASHFSPGMTRPTKPVSAGVQGFAKKAISPSPYSLMSYRMKSPLPRQAAVNLPVRPALNATLIKDYEACHQVAVVKVEIEDDLQNLPLSVPSASCQSKECSVVNTTDQYNQVI